MIKIPSQSGWSQNNRSDTIGSIWSSWNLDLNANPEKVRVSPRSLITTDAIANLGVPIGFERFNGGSGQNGFFTIAGDRAFSTSTVDASVAFAASSGSATTHSADTADLMFFRRANFLVSTMQQTLQLHNASSWSSVAGAPLVSNTVHMLTQYGLLGYVTNNFKTVISFDTSMNTTAAGNPNTFSLGTLSSDNVGLFFSKIIGARDRIWMFTINAAVARSANTYTWDGATQDEPSAIYVHEHAGVVAAILRNDTPYIMSVEGYLEVFNGWTFVKVPNGRLPINPDKFLKNSFSSLNDRWIHPNGMIITEDNKINILINNEYSDGTFEENLPAGIWEFDLNNSDKGWYHTLSPSLYTNSITDHGQNRLSRVGAIHYAKTTSGSGSLLIGVQLYPDASTTKNVIETNNTVDNIQKYGYLVTTKIYSNQIQDSWQRLYVRIKKLLSATDKVIVKFRVDESESTVATITWTSTTTCTTTTNVSAFLGYEMEVLQGKGGGKCSKITNVTESGGTYTITLQETFTGATSGTAKARFQYWREMGGFTSLADSIIDFPFGNSVASTWVQLKICMQFTGKDEIDDIIVANRIHRLVE
jgi:hypothetical protein